MNSSADEPKKLDDTDFRTVAYRMGEESTTITRRAATIQPALVAVQGESPGRVHRLKNGANLIGREMLCDICTNERAASRRHAEICWTGNTVVLKDLGSTNGTLLNGRAIDEPVPPVSGNLIKVGSCVFKFIDSLLDVEMSEALYAKGTTDPLTGICNKAHLLAAIASSFDIAKGGSALSLIVFDLDHFKLVNDTHGHLAGDFVLKETCRVVKTILRPEATFGRFGGEEFIVLLPDLKLNEAVGVAERIRAGIETHPFEFSGVKIPVTVSLGVCEFNASFQNADDMIGAADAMLYTSKGEGRNRVSA